MGNSAAHRLAALAAGKWARSRSACGRGAGLEGCLDLGWQNAFGIMREPIQAFQRVYRFIYWVGYVFIYGYRFLRRSHTYGVQLIVTTGTELLLVKHTYGHRAEWSLPGGGRGKRKSALACAHRELAEELGVTGAMRKVDVVELFHDYHDDTVTVFVVTGISEEPKFDKIEIADAQWFDINRLPRNLTTLTRHVLQRTLSRVTQGS
jgi:8-oxo-dGTP pyrophosphatase MutT (NUDIX family)